MKGWLPSLFLLALLTSSALALDSACAHKLFPNFAGGSKNEDVKCFLFDPKTEYIIVGGTSTSNDFAPAENQHGFLYALDLNANWKWGNFFYNVSYAVSDITGCQMSSEGTSLMVFGQANSRPVIMSLSHTDGSITKFLSIEAVTPDGSTPII